jgi:hypothetical protein
LLKVRIGGEDLSYRDDIFERLIERKLLFEWSQLEFGTGNRPFLDDDDDSFRLL